RLILLRDSKRFRFVMLNRIRVFIVTSTLLVASVESAAAQNGPQAQPPRAYPTYAADPAGVGGNRYPDRVPAQQIDPGIAPHTDNSRGPAVAQNPPPPPFTLNPQEQADLNQILSAWEQKNGQIKTFKCNFDRRQYDPVFMPKPSDGPEEPIQTSRGEIKYE